MLFSKFLLLAGTVLSSAFAGTHLPSWPPRLTPALVGFGKRFVEQGVLVHDANSLLSKTFHAGGFEENYPIILQDVYDIANGMNKTAVWLAGFAGFNTQEEREWAAAAWALLRNTYIAYFWTLRYKVDAASGAGLRTRILAALNDKVDPASNIFYGNLEPIIDDAGEWVWYSGEPFGEAIISAMSVYSADNPQDP